MAYNEFPCNLLNTIEKTTNSGAKDINVWSCSNSWRQN